MNTPNDIVIFGGSSSGKLAQRVASLLDHAVGRTFIEHFPDGEINVRIDEPVRGRDVFILQSTSPPVCENLFELLALADASRRSGACAIKAVIPYFGYARSDKRHGRREPIMARLVAEMIERAGIGHVLTVDLHAPQIEGFFHIPVDTLTAIPTLVGAMKHELPRDLVVVSPDGGRVKIATDIGRWLGQPVAVLNKVRNGTDTSFATKVIGDVAGKPSLIVDDIIATGITIFEATNALVHAGAKAEVYIAATHPVLTNGSREKLEHPAIQRVFVTDSVASEAAPASLQVVSLDRLLAAAIRRMHGNESMADLYSHAMNGTRACERHRLIPNAAGD